MDATLKPIPIKKWLEDNAHLLQPPVSNRCLYKGEDFIVMLVVGPNQRTDYHINPTEEWFFQVQGDMLLKVVDEKNRFLDIHIHEGDMLLLPASIPHSPNRFKDTIGLVIERPRPSGKKDALRWYCESCKAILFEDSFECTDLNVQLAPVIQAFYASKDLRTCKKCGLLNPGKDF